VGAVLSTGTDGPLRLGVGGLADQVHRLTVVTGEGRVLQSDEPAHADLVRLQLGTFGGLGVICEAALHLHELPRTDTTWVRGGSR
ncbi:MAG: FAD-binding oxidoreductase, partial [Gemmatimonadetes bacterium]|nr:FAD-binding oxidoreductase [Gemmatimonadota bacterium]